MNLSELARFTPGQAVNVRCRTSAASIFYKGPADLGRSRYTPTGPQVAAIPYLLHGRVVGVEKGEIDYLVLESKGEAAVFGLKRGFLQVLGTEIRTKTLHIPVSAIENVSRYA